MIPPWPLPKIFRLTKGDKLNHGIFRGETINTPSMLCVEDALDALKWAESIGGRDSLIARCEGSLAVIADWVAGADWADFLAREPVTRSCTSVCLKFSGARAGAMDRDAQARLAKSLNALLDTEGVAHDINAYRDAPPGLRIWTGATIERGDVEALMPWLDWAFAEVAGELPVG